MRQHSCSMASRHYRVRYWFHAESDSFFVTYGTDDEIADQMDRSYDMALSNELERDEFFARGAAPFEQQAEALWYEQAGHSTIRWDQLSEATKALWRDKADPI